MLCGCVLQRGNSGDGCELALTLCKYDLRKRALGGGKSAVQILNSVGERMPH